MSLRQDLEVVLGTALLSPGEMSCTDHLAQPPVTLRIAGQH